MQVKDVLQKVQNVVEKELGIPVTIGEQDGIALHRAYLSDRRYLVIYFEEDEFRKLVNIKDIRAYYGYENS